jgi:hypothetical protein
MEKEILALLDKLTSKKYIKKWSRPHSNLISILIFPGWFFSINSFIPVSI